VLESYKTGGFGMGKKLIRQVPMTKDVKVVKDIKNIHANGHLST
jgi:hypothetical protein